MDEIRRIKESIDNAEAIVIGAGAGLSTAAGFEYGGQYFLDNFPDIYKKYGKLGIPEPGAMLMKHTPVPVSGLFMPAFYTGLLAEMVLHGTNMMPFEQARLYKTFMYCPLCVKEDLDRAGRAAIHVPHQVPVGLLHLYTLA